MLREPIDPWLWQGVSLVLSSCHAMGHRPEQQTLASLVGAMRAGLARYKRSELAACLEAFQAWRHDPGSDVLQVSVALNPTASSKAELFLG